jgi:hypothetical protein
VLEAGDCVCLNSDWLFFCGAPGDQIGLSRNLPTCNIARWLESLRRSLSSETQENSSSDSHLITSRSQRVFGAWILFRSAGRNSGIGLSYLRIERNREGSATRSETLFNQSLAMFTSSLAVRRAALCH